MGSEDSQLLHLVDERSALQTAPPITQPTDSNVRSISSRSAPLNVVGGPLVHCLHIVRKGIPKQAILRKDHGMFDQVLQLADISGHSYELSAAIVF